MNQCYSVLIHTDLFVLAIPQIREFDPIREAHFVFNSGTFVQRTFSDPDARPILRAIIKRKDFIPDKKIWKIHWALHVWKNNLENGGIWHDGRLLHQDKTLVSAFSWSREGNPLWCQVFLLSRLFFDTHHAQWIFQIFLSGMKFFRLMKAWSIGLASGSEKIYG